MYTMQLGLNDQHTKKQEIKTPEAVALMLRTRAKHGIDGLTYSTRNGVYTHGCGAVVCETVLEITIYAAPTATVTAFAHDLKTLFNQEALYVTVQAVQSIAI
jgi:GH24 family phage-related lysozyme (muramidase)